MPSHEFRPPSQNQIFASAINAAVSTVATIPAVAGLTAYLTGIDFYGGGATLASVINVAITGLQGGTINIPIGVLAGVLAPAHSPYPLTIRPVDPLPASGTNVAIVVTEPSLGANSTQQSVVVWGFYSSD